MSRIFACRAALVTLLAATLACSTITDLVERGRSAQSTVEAFATEGNALAATAEALATDLDAGNLEATAQALATKLAGSGLSATAEALASEQAVELPTLPPLATDDSFGPGEAPADIPLMDGERELFFGSEDVISYFIQADYAAVLEFYKQGMPDDGWRFVSDQSVESDGAAVLVYEKTDRSALVTISRDASQNRVSVQVLILPR